MLVCADIWSLIFHVILGWIMEELYVCCPRRGQNGGNICGMITGTFRISGNEEGSCKTNEFWTETKQIEDVIEMAS
jgi:hypothetical protein